MLSISTLSILAILISAPSAMGFAIEPIPSQTLKEFGFPFSPAPTQAPSIELLRAKLNKRAASNICSEWTIPSGSGQPQCGASQTCLFQTADGNFYEGCGEPGVEYDWVTQCSDYPQSGVAPVSEIYCPESAPYCGYFGFVFTPGYTAYNFGCSTSSFGVEVLLVSSESTFGTATDANTKITASITRRTSTTPVFIPVGTTTTLSHTRTASSSTSTSNPTINSHAVKASIGLVAGVIVGGLVLIAIIVGLLIYCCVRKRRHGRIALASNVQQQHTSNGPQEQQWIPEIGGTGVIGKPAQSGGRQDGRERPPGYQQGQSPVRSSQQVYRELASPQSELERIFSPMTSMPSQTPILEMDGNSQSRSEESVDDVRQPSPSPQQIYQLYPSPSTRQKPAATELVGSNRESSLPSRSSIQEMGVGTENITSNPPRGHVPTSEVPHVAETSTSTGNSLARRPVGAPHFPSGEDTGGVPAKDSWNRHYELA